MEKEIKTVKLEVTANELRAVAIAIDSYGWKTVDFPIVTALIEKIRAGAKEFEVKEVK